MEGDMKERSKNSRIKLKCDEVKIIIDSLNHWLKIDAQKFTGKTQETVKSVMDFIKLKTIMIKNEYSLNFNCDQLIYIHGAVAEEYIDYKNTERDKAQTICVNIENILQSNYKIRYGELCYPSYKW
jgi:hypothetical protein